MRNRSMLPTLVLIAGLTFGVPLAVVAAQADEPTVVAANLTNPRGFTWDAGGRLIVAEAGSGGTSEASGEAEVPSPTGPYTGGATGAVVAIDNGCPISLADGLPSAASATGEVVGVADVAELGDALYALVSGGGAAHGNPDQPNGVYRIEDGKATLVADLGAWLRANPVAAPPEADFDPEGSFYAMEAAADGSALWVVESNSEQLLSVTPEGGVTRVADFSAGDRVPTALALAPDGGLYVGELTGAPYPKGGATVRRVDADGNAETVWTGLTAVTGLAVDADGTLYAAQLSESRNRAPFLQPGTGSIVRQTGKDGAEPVATGLNFPSAIGFGPDGALYVASPAIGANDGTGSIVRFVPGDAPQSLNAGTLPGPTCGDASAGTGPSGGDTSAPDEYVVRIFDFGFDSETMTVPVGATVTWANTGAVQHTTVSFQNGAKYWDSGIMEPGDIFTFTFTEAGTFDYECGLHPKMKGTIVVQ